MRNDRRLLPLRRDKCGAIHDFWHTIRWGLVIGALIFVAVTAFTA